MSSHLIDVDDDVQFVDSPVEEVENIATLFMSCSPGRDTEEEEDEDDSVPLSKFYGVSNVVIKVLCNIIRPHRSTTYVVHMRSIVTDRVAWSVGLSVCHTSELC